MAKKIDLQALRQQINELQIDKDLKHDLLAAINDKQRYGLVWEESSEEACDKMQDQLPVFVEDTTKRLDSAPEGSPNHILIEGDNLNALAALTYAYAGKIDVIYIDPPYNTGNKDFIYNDSFVDKEDGYRHSKWLSFMNRRLKIAKQLLSEKGLIFISIDDNEASQLKLLCDEVFGGKNYLNQFSWVSNITGRQISGRGAAKTWESVFVYSKNIDNTYSLLVDVVFAKKFMPDAYKGFKKDIREDEYGKFAVGDTLYNHNRKFNEETRRNLVFSIFYNPQTQDITTGEIGSEREGYIEILPHANGDGIHKYHAWRWSKEKVENEKYNLIVLKVSKGYEVYTRIRDFNTTLLKDIITNISNGDAELQSIFDGKKYFDYPKSVALLVALLGSTNNKHATILDFFAGSGTTLHATMQLNSEDGGHRKCILVTNNENNICEKVTYERNKRVIKGYTNQKGEEVPGLTHNNLRYYKTEFVPRDQSNFKSRRALMASLVDLLCIKNNIYQEQETFGGKKFKKSVLRYFKDEAGQMLVVLDERVVSIVIPMIAEVATRQNPLKVYVYSDGAYAYEDEFHKVMPVIELCAMPDAFLQALEGGTDILPKRKYSEAMMKEFQQNEELAMQNEEVVKEALSDDYDYVLKEKEDSVTNDIID